MKETNKNFLYNVIYQIFILVIPLITTPYISRILGVEGIGIYSFTYSIVYYFMLFSMIGINNYGARCIAKCEDNVKERSETFWSIYLLQVTLTIIFSTLYFIIIYFSKYEYKNIMYLQSVFLLSVVFDINWFYFGLEKFKITISRNIIIKFVSLFLIFFFVKDRNDLWIYTLIMSSCMVFSQLYLWIHLKKFIKIVKIEFKDVIKNLKPCLILFIPVLAYSIYRVMDKTMIGIYSNSLELGNYESAEKIINIPLSFSMALGTVMIPHMSKIKEKTLKKEIFASFELCFCFIIPMTMGLFVISKDFSLLFFGKEFTKAGMIIRVLTPSIIVSAIANVIRTNYLIPTEKDNVYVKSTILGAFVNLIFNFLLIKKYGAFGACIGTILAEVSVMLYQIIKTKDEIDYKEIMKLFLKYFYKSFLSIIVICIIGKIINNVVIRVILQVAICCILYFFMNKNYIIYDFFQIKNTRGK